MSAAAPLDELSETEFGQIVAIAAQDAGLAIPMSKKSLVQSRVMRRMREIGVSDSGEYFSRLSQDQAERNELIYVLTTNVSHFFREEHHFEILRKHIQSKTSGTGLRIWSAGCSNGQEPYTLAFEILRAFPDAAQKNVLVLASDIDPNVLAKAKSGVYSNTEIEGVPEQYRSKFFHQTSDNNFKVRDEISALVRFRTLNLNASWPMKGAFDVIMCRNVVIYFDDDTQRALWPRFHEKLAPDGILMLGHSERIHPLEGSGFENIGVTTYRKL